MPPGPVAGVLFGLRQAAVRAFLHVDQGDVALVGLRFFIHQAEYAGSAGTGHDDGVDLLGQLVDVAGELLCHVQEGHKDADAEGFAG